MKRKPDAFDILLHEFYSGNKYHPDLMWARRAVDAEGRAFYNRVTPRKPRKRRR